MNTKPRIVFCSLYKPVTDSRMYEKLAYSLSKSGKYEIIIIGHSSGNIPTEGNNGILFMPLFSFGRLALKRLFAPLKLYVNLVKLKPHIIINNTVDFLFVISVYKSIYRSRFIYDVQENYYYNIRYNRYIPSLFRYFIAISVRCIEIICSPFVDHFILAEKTYVNEIKFIRKGKYIILENKYAAPSFFIESGSRTRKKDRIMLLYSGTIAEHYGIFEIIRFVISFHEHYQNVYLHIIGYCPHKKTLNKVKEIIKPLKYITLTGGNKPVPHPEILTAIHNADAGIINYHINPSTENRFPTRLYEYLANRLPVLVQEHKSWSDRVLQARAGLIVNFKSPDYDMIYNRLINIDFYSVSNQTDLRWTEEEQLLDILVRKLD